MLFVRLVCFSLVGGAVAVDLKIEIFEPSSNSVQRLSFNFDGSHDGDIKILVRDAIEGLLINEFGATVAERAAKEHEEYESTLAWIISVGTMLLVIGCTLSMCVKVGPKPKQPQRLKDSIKKVKMIKNPSNFAELVGEEVCETSTQPWPEDCKPGLLMDLDNNGELIEVKENGWAYENTNLINHIGWHIVKINSEHVPGRKEFEKVLRALRPGDAVTFMLKKTVFHLEKCWPNLGKNLNLLEFVAITPNISPDNDPPPSTELEDASAMSLTIYDPTIQ